MEYHNSLKDRGSKQEDYISEFMFQTF